MYPDQGLGFIGQFEQIGTFLSSEVGEIGEEKVGISSDGQFQQIRE